LSSPLLSPLATPTPQPLVISFSPRDEAGQLE
jgi:hypothetical protein